MSSAVVRDKATVSKSRELHTAGSGFAQEARARMTAPLPDDDDDIQVSVEDVLQYADVHVGNIKVTGNVKTNTAFILNEIDLQGVRSLSDIVESCQYAHEVCRGVSVCCARTDRYVYVGPETIGDIRDRQYFS